MLENMKNRPNNSHITVVKLRNKLRSTNYSQHKSLQVPLRCATAKLTDGSLLPQKANIPKMALRVENRLPRIMPSILLIVQSRSTLEKPKLYINILEAVAHQNNMIKWTAPPKLAA